MLTYRRLKPLKSCGQYLEWSTFVREFIPNLVSVIAPLVTLTQEEAVEEVAKRWNSEHDRAYATVKQLLTQAPVLQFPDFSKDFAIHVDASEAGAGAFLAQQKGDGLVIIACFSQRFNDKPTPLLRYTQNNVTPLCWQYSTGGPIYGDDILCVCDGSRGTTVPILNARHIEHVNTLGDRIAVV